MKNSNEHVPDKAVLALLARVRRSLAKDGTTLIDLADRTGIKANNISRMLAGKNNMRLDLFIKLLDAADYKISLKKFPKNK